MAYYKRQQSEQFKKDAALGNHHLAMILKSIDINFRLENENPYSPYDAIATDRQGKKWLIETKHRGTEYDEMMLENKKYNALVRAAKKLGKAFSPDRILYVNTFDNNKGILWTLTPEYVKGCEKRSLQAATTTSVKGKVVNKKVIMLPKDRCFATIDYTAMREAYELRQKQIRENQNRL